MPNLSKDHVAFLKECLVKRLEEDYIKTGISKPTTEESIFPKYGESALIYYFDKNVNKGGEFPNLKRPEGSLPDMMLRDEKVLQNLLKNKVFNNLYIKKDTSKKWPISPEAHLTRRLKESVEFKNLEKHAFEAYFTYAGFENEDAFFNSFSVQIKQNTEIISDNTQPGDQPILPANEVLDPPSRYRTPSQETQGGGITALPTTATFFQKRWLLSSILVLLLLSSIAYCLKNADQAFDTVRLPKLVEGRLEPKFDSICGEVTFTFKSFECKDTPIMGQYAIEGKRTGLFEGSYDHLKNSEGDKLKFYHIYYSSESDGWHLFFKFQAYGRGNNAGFVDLTQIQKSTNEITGIIHYLYNDDNQRWAMVNIKFKRKPQSQPANGDPMNIVGTWSYTVTPRDDDATIKIVNRKKGLFSR